MSRKQKWALWKALFACLIFLIHYLQGMNKNEMYFYFFYLGIQLINYIIGRPEKTD